ncbi:MAG: thiamine pyrophosphate-dependent dehydrogenase E1 component subunit alpha [Peptococcaceae bacterium]|jgi:pyruvate dehydrogenase E1 component alpha subunit|nr:thiamine pyrophosphate-dependent dehydrogenase E1 component subunit alpha [Peptococcaceae bacterium]
MTNDKMLEMYRVMLLTRRFEEKLADLCQIEGKVPGMMILCTGQEAVAAGACLALEQGDVIIANHRSHGHLIAKGADPKLIMAEIFGKRTGYNKGKSGTLHIAVPEVDAHCTTTIVGGGIPIAVGTAFAHQYNNSRKVTVCFFGDGAADEGSFHESLNLAALWSLPVIFVCENNVYAGAQRMEEHTRIKDIAVRSVAYNVPGETVDGNDATAVYEAVARARERCLNGEGPVLIEAKTYRWRGHGEIDKQAYQPRDEISAWMQRCPVNKLEQDILQMGLLSQSAFVDMERDIGNIVEQAVRFAEESPWPDPGEALQDVYA